MELLEFVLAPGSKKTIRGSDIVAIKIEQCLNSFCSALLANLLFHNGEKQAPCCRAHKTINTGTFGSLITLYIISKLYIKCRIYGTGKKVLYSHPPFYLVNCCPGISLTVDCIAISASTATAGTKVLTGAIRRSSNAKRCPCVFAYNAVRSKIT